MTTQESLPIRTLVGFGDYLLTFGVSDGEIGERSFRELADQLMAAGSAVVRLQRLRGDVPGDDPDQAHDALYAAELCLNWAAAMREFAAHPESVKDMGR